MYVQSRTLKTSSESLMVMVMVMVKRTVTDCRVYAEKFDSHGIRLYITKIRDGDDGIYKCRARITETGQMLEQETRMFLYGNLQLRAVVANANSSSKLSLLTTTLKLSPASMHPPVAYFPSQ